MERRVRGNPHARCGLGENEEITSNHYLSVSPDQQIESKQAAMQIQETSPVNPIDEIMLSSKVVKNSLY